MAALVLILVALVGRGIPNEMFRTFPQETCFSNLERSKTLDMDNEDSFERSAPCFEWGLRVLFSTTP